MDHNPGPVRAHGQPIEPKTEVQLRKLARALISIAGRQARQEKQRTTEEEASGAAPDPDSGAGA